MLFHPGSQLFQQGFGLFLVADEVVVDDECRMKSGATHVVQLGHQLIRILDPGLATVNHDDVAKLALKRAAPRVLQRAGGVAVDLQQIEARPRHREHVRRLRLLVARRRGPAAGKVIEELGPGRLGFAHERHVAQACEELFLHRDEWPAHDREDPQLAQLQQDLPGAHLLHVHPGYAHQVVGAQLFPVDLFHVLVQQGDVVVAAQSGHRRERSGDHRAALIARIEWQREIESPIRRLETRVDQTYGEPLGGRHGLGRNRGQRKQIDIHLAAFMRFLQLGSKCGIDRKAVGDEHGTGLATFTE